MTNRIKIYAAIDGERDYQEDLWKYQCAVAEIPYTPDFQKTTADYLVDIMGCNVDLVHSASRIAAQPPPMHIFRELASLCVACMEANGGCARDVNSGAPGPFQESLLSRKRVYRIIDTERMYQDDIGDYQPQTVNGFVIVFQHYLMKAHEQWTIHPGDEYALNIIRQLAGIAVHAMEMHGVVLREPFEI